MQYQDRRNTDMDTHYLCIKYRGIVVLSLRKISSLTVSNEISVPPLKDTGVEREKKKKKREIEISLKSFSSALGKPAIQD